MTNNNNDDYMCNDVSLLMDQVLEGIESNKKDYKKLREDNLELLENHQKEVLKHLNESYTKIINNKNLIQNSDLKVNQKSNYNEDTKHIYMEKVKPINEYLEKVNSKIMNEILKVNNNDVNLMLNENEMNNENKLKEFDKTIKQLKIDKQKFEHSINSLQKELTDNKNINDHKNQKKNRYMYVNIGFSGIVALCLIFILIIKPFFIKDGQFTYPKLNKTISPINTPVNNKSKLNNKTISPINTPVNNKSKLNNKSILNTKK